MTDARGCRTGFSPRPTQTNVRLFWTMLIAAWSKQFAAWQPGRPHEGKQPSYLSELSARVSMLKIGRDAVSVGGSSVEFTPQWVAVILTLMGMSGGLGAWLQEQRYKHRAALPIVRTQWNVGERGFAAKVTIVNRLNEDIYVTSAECRSNFSNVDREYDPSTGQVNFAYTPVESPLAFNWVVPALGEGTETFKIDGAATERWLRLTLSSSAKTFRRKRLTVEGASTI